MDAARAPAFFDYLTERENVRLCKEAGDFFPWTEDPILQTFKFTNVRRQHDRTSNELREKFYKEHFNDDRRAILMNCATFRYFGTYEFANAIGWTDFGDMDEGHWDYVKETAHDRLANRERVFTGAYVITNQGISAPKQEVVVDYFLKGLQANADLICNHADISQSWREVADMMRPIKGLRWHWLHDQGSSAGHDLHWLLGELSRGTQRTRLHVPIGLERLDAHRSRRSAWRCPCSRRRYGKASQER